MRGLAQLVLVLGIGFPNWVGAKTLTVGKPSGYRTIAEAVAAAADNDTVFVGPGTYHEHNLVVDKSIKLFGKGRPVIDGEGKYENISIKADNVVVDGFRVCNSGISSITDFAGIKICNRRNVTVTNNQLDNCFFGIYSQYGIHCTITNNVLRANQVQEQKSGNGIHCWKSDGMVIANNNVSGHRDGIYFEFVTNSVIQNNKSYKNLRYGLHFMFSNNDSYEGNLFENNGAGVAVMFSNHVKMHRNIFRENWGDASHGMLLKEISDSRIDNNTFERNTNGIFMEGVSRVEMYKNLFHGNGWGLKIQASCMDITLKNNNFISNTFDVGTNGSLVLNTFEYNYWDKYEGYDLNRDKIGDIPYRPVSVYSMIVERNPPVMVLFRSLITTLMDRSEKILPTITPENLKDTHPLMKPCAL